MKIVVNGTWRELEPHAAERNEAMAAPTLERVLLDLGFADRIVATALNGEFVSTGARTGVRVRDGDRLEVVAPMQGG